MVFAIGSLSAHLYRDDSGRWYSYDKKTGMRNYIFSLKNTSDPRYRKREEPQNNPYDTSFYSDPTYRIQDGTDKNFGNR